MSRAEEKGYEAYPIIMHTLIPVHEDMPNIEQDCNVFHRQAYIKGYHQAEKDLELTWEDMRELHVIFTSVDTDIEMGMADIKSETLGYYQEVLKRFKNLKK